MKSIQFSQDGLWMSLERVNLSSTDPKTPRLNITAECELCCHRCTLTFAMKDKPLSATAEELGEAFSLLCSLQEAWDLGSPAVTSGLPSLPSAVGGE